METLPLILDVQDLKAGYGSREVLHGISFAVNKGDFLGIAGPNGVGKSTLLRTLAGLLKPASGRISFFNKPLSDYPRRRLAQLLAVIFQDFSSPYDFTVFDIIAMGRGPFIPRWKPLSREDHRVIFEAMETTDLVTLRDRPFSELSGGEKQRVIIAKALAQEPALLLLDEPATHLDIHHQVNVFSILRRLNRESNVTIICITHDLSLGAQYLHRLLLLDEGRILAEGTPKDVIRKDLVEDLFRTQVSVGTLAETDTPYILPLIENTLNKSS